VYALQECAYALLVSIDEHGDAAAGAGVQRGGGADFAAAAGDGAARTVCVSRLVVVRPASSFVRLGAAGDCAAGVGLPGVERSPSESERVVHAEAVDFFAGSRRSTDSAVVDSGGTATGAISLDDREVSRHSGVAGVGGGVGGDGAAVHRRGVAGLFAGARENVERSVHGAAGGGVGDDGGGLVGGVLN